MIHSLFNGWIIFLEIEKEKDRKEKKFSRQIPGDKTKNKNYEQTLTQK